MCGVAGFTDVLSNLSNETLVIALELAEQQRAICLLHWARRSVVTYGVQPRKPEPQAKSAYKKENSTSKRHNNNSNNNNNSAKQHQHTTKNNSKQHQHLDVTINTCAKQQQKQVNSDCKTTKQQSTQTPFRHTQADLEGVRRGGASRPTTYQNRTCQKEDMEVG